MGYAPKNPKRDGAFRRVVVQVEPRERHGPHQTRILRAGVTLRA